MPGKVAERLTHNSHERTSLKHPRERLHRIQNLQLLQCASLRVWLGVRLWSFLKSKSCNRLFATKIGQLTNKGLEQVLQFQEVSTGSEYTARSGC